jgi:hypothetical protein
MIILLRGHIRNSFDNNNLYNLIKKISQLCDISIYIHTWNVFANNISWREIKENNTVVTKNIIYNYFKDLSTKINHIIIDDDTQIKLHGRLDGVISNTKTPILGWKRYWYGKYKLIKYVIESNNHLKNAINLRFDILNNSNNFNPNILIDFIKDNLYMSFEKIIFVPNSRENSGGIDNFYIGNLKIIYILSHSFHFDMDKYIKDYDITDGTERIVPDINNKLNYKIEIKLKDDEIKLKNDDKKNKLISNKKIFKFKLVKTDNIVNI